MRVVKNYLDKDYFNKLKDAFVENTETLPLYIQRTVAYKTNK